MYENVLLEACFLYKMLQRSNNIDFLSSSSATYLAIIMMKCTNRGLMLKLKILQFFWKTYADLHFPFIIFFLKVHALN